MAITKLMHIKERKRGNPSEGLKNAITYILNPDKTRNGKLVGSLNCTPSLAYKKMLATKKLYEKTTGRQGYHFILSFSPGEVTPEKAYQIADEFCRKYLGTAYESVFAVHEDKEHVHAHIVFNSVSIKTGLKYHYNRGDWRKYVQPITNQICERYGLETIDVDEKSVTDDFDDYGKWEGAVNQRTPTNREQLRALIDQLIPEVNSLDELIAKLNLAGCKVRSGKYLSIKLPDAERAIRSYRLGIAYEQENLEKRIAGKMIYAPYKATPEPLAKEQYKIVRAGFKQDGKRSIYTSEYYKYKDEITKLRQINRKNRYLTTYHITTEAQLKARQDQVEQQLKEINKKRKELFASRRMYQDEIDIIKNYSKEEAEQRLAERSFDADSLIAFEAATAEELSQLKSEKRELQREVELLKKIVLQPTGRQI